jgi:hypothetical protein
MSSFHRPVVIGHPKLVGVGGSEWWPRKSCLNGARGKFKSACGAIEALRSLLGNDQFVA